MMDKGSLRKNLLAMRRSLSEEEVREKSDRLMVNLKSSELYQKSRGILSYFSHLKEADLMGLVNEDRVWGFPKIEGKNLKWYEWKVGDPVMVNRYGIREPIADRLIDAGDVDLMLVPAIGCDRRGYRLGYGGGYYDRLLSEPEFGVIPSIGVVFDFAYVEELAIDPWDKPLTAICTEVNFELIMMRGDDC